MAEPRSIHDLGPEVSIRYAEDQKKSEGMQPLLKEGRSISSQTQITATTSSLTSAVSDLFGTNLANRPHALFPHLDISQLIQKSSCYANQILPRVNREHLDVLAQRVNNTPAPDDEKAALLKLLHDTLPPIEKTLEEIKSHLGQYQKG